MNIGEYKIIMGALEFGGLSDEPINEAYEMADKLYENGRDMTVMVYYDSWGDNKFVELPYAGPEKGETI